MILHHLCKKCGHPDYFHATTDCSYGHCRCELARTSDLGPTVTGPTWDEAFSAVLTVTPPGTRWPKRGQGHVTCACDECQSEYARLTGASA